MTLNKIKNRLVFLKSIFFVNKNEIGLNDWIWSFFVCEFFESICGTRNGNIVSGKCPARILWQLQRIYKKKSNNNRQAARGERFHLYTSMSLSGANVKGLEGGGETNSFRGNYPTQTETAIKVRTRGRIIFVGNTTHLDYYWKRTLIVRGRLNETYDGSRWN